MPSDLRLLNIARGCHDYGGGYFHVIERDAFHHGIQTVINALEAACNGDESLGNARLIAAAAPDLLEACKLAKKHLEPDLIEPGRTVFWALVDAIAKADTRERTSKS